jgi:hypothetical protein
MKRYLKIVRKSVEKIQVSLKSDKNNWYFTWRRMYIFDNIWVLLRVRYFCSKIVEKIKRYILSSIILFRKSRRLWGNKCIIAYPLQQWLCEGATVIRYWYIAYLFSALCYHSSYTCLLNTSIKHGYSELTVHSHKTLLFCSCLWSS